MNLDQPMGANGGDSSMVLQYLRHKILHHDDDNQDNGGGILLKDVDYLFLNCGLHDIKVVDLTTSQNQIPIEQYQQNLKEIIKLVQSSLPQTKLIWIRTTPLDEQNHNDTIKYKKKFHRYEKDLTSYNKAADDIMTTNNIPMIDLFQFTSNLQKHGDTLYCDHIHFETHIREKQGAFRPEQQRHLDARLIKVSSTL